MDVRPIRNDADHAAALRRIEELWEAPEGSEESDELEVLSTLVSVYEDTRWPIDAPDAVDVLRYVMERRNLSASDLVPYIGQRGRVYDVLNRRRDLSGVQRGNGVGRRQRYGRRRAVNVDGHGLRRRDIPGGIGRDGGDGLG